MVERILVEMELDHLIQPGMGFLLFALFAEDDRTVKELAAQSQLAGSTLTRLLTRMEETGLDFPVVETTPGWRAGVKGDPMQ